MVSNIPKLQVPLSSNEHLLWEGRPARIILVVTALLLGLPTLIILFALLIMNIKILVIASALLIIGFVIARPLFYKTGLTISELLTMRYQLTDQRLITSKGLLSRQVSELDLVYFRATSVNQNHIFRIFGVGNIHLSRDQYGGSTIEIIAISEPVQIKELARNAILNRRAALGMHYMDIA